MGYRIEKGESLAAALGRITAEEMNFAQRELGHGAKGGGKNVHNARKAIKRLRALLRSLRVVFPREFYHAENQRLAEAGRKISPVRDIHVQLRALGKFRDTRGRAAVRMRGQLLRQQAALERKLPALRLAVRQMLEHSRGTIETWPLDKTTPMTLAGGIKRMYKQGQDAFKTARKKPTPENLHEWRKKAKSLGYGFELVECFLPKKILKRMELCQDLSDELGDDHDLFVLLQALDRENKSAPAHDFAKLARRIAARRKKLAKKAFKIGKRLYNEKPRVFARRLDRHFGRAAKK
jgi:CHAD domain-containing protein